MVEYKPKYNPADNAEVESIAKKMTKPELEEYYVKDRNKRYITCGEGVGIFIVICIMVFGIGSIGFLIGEVISIDKVDDNIQEISQEICTYLGKGFVSDEVLELDSREVKIVCDQINSNRWGK